jgi:hypothetical protein
MKLIVGLTVSCLAMNAISLAPSSARFAQRQTRQVPISRLLKNLEAQREDAMGATDKAMVDFRLGRLHAMAYAQNTESAPCDAGALPGSRYELPDFGNTPDHLQFTAGDKKKKSPSAQEHLKAAINYLQTAVKKDPGLLSAKLGLAWCIDQSGDKNKARLLYREIFTEAYKAECDSKGGMYSWSIAVETANYLKPLLDPVRDKAELDLVDSQVKELNKLPRMITPIAVSLSAGADLKEVIQNKAVEFDLDGFGKRKYQQWISPKAAWLVLDSDGRGFIDSGLKLIGQSSFWIFWNNGYEVLKALDDNHDGKLTGAELNGIALWQDLNCNGISEKNEVRSLVQYGITAISTRATKHSSSILWNESGVSMRNRKTLPTFDLVLGSALNPSIAPPAKAPMPLKSIAH